MIARKCDRCGEFYDIAKKSLHGIATHEKATNGAVSGYLSYYDLCTECMKKFAKWVSGEEKQTGWISVEDRLPQEYTPVLVCYIGAEDSIKEGRIVQMELRIIITDHGAGG